MSSRGTDFSALAPDSSLWSNVGCMAVPASSRHEGMTTASSEIGEACGASAAPEKSESLHLEHDVLKVQEVAEILRMEERLVYDAIKRGQIPGVRRFGKRGII